METTVPVVIDTNVLLVANHKAEQASRTCIATCVKIIAQIRQNGIVVIDNQRFALKEYGNKLNEKGQPGVGDGFLKWLLTYQTNPRHCQQVAINETAAGSGEFLEFPTDPALQKFERSDRKWVAIALAHPATPTILNAADTDWKDFESELGVYGIKIQFPCTELMLRAKS